ncbi:tRNA epoxyqueuosine(34) reductase QueG [Rhizobium alvei]|uniref:tRNA epoxyqueuosine(34) reductase QueG n=1 Tax=Rhizobium alvei TaxID=1132659 RepID=A0ABT8YPG8_9HYPH|nr:tRNA epoxyqueuosine(34) reductase QueG [Rhizobium alvei]MDO6965596.1 tRNA epoxyqueuosine(34) reductase QueG [Rhizobium alvei]
MAGERSTSEDKVSRLTGFVKQCASEAGFDLCRITSSDLGPQPGLDLARYVANGHHGTMSWMQETLDRRSSPRALWPDVRSVIMLGMNYGPESDPRDILARKSQGAISVYAQNRDYHDIIKGKLKEIGGRFAARCGEEIKVFVDTAPVMEKPLAANAGLGWQGKHTNLVSRQFGSWLFLGSIFTTAILDFDEAETDHCGSCRACLDSCPTSAFPAPYRIDARRCISYLTIEHKGTIAPDMRLLMGNRIYGCDDCLAACPWNKFAQAARELKLKARVDLQSPQLADLLQLDDAGFRSFFSGSPVKRIGRNRFVRNCLIAAGNSGDIRLLERCRQLLTDPSGEVRGMAAWAVWRLGGETALSSERRLLLNESDPDVIAEWTRCGVSA